MPDSDKSNKLNLSDKIIILLETANMPLDESDVAEILGANAGSVRVILGELRKRGTVEKSNTSKLWSFRKDKPTI